MQRSIEALHNFSPLDKIQGVFTASPGVESTLGLLMPPEESLFEPDGENASILLARNDHLRMTTELSRRGITVFSMRKIIGEEIAQKNTSGFETPEQLLKELKRRAVLLHQKYNLGNLDQAYHELTELLFQDVQEMGADTAVAINGVLTNCIDPFGKRISFDQALPPAANFLFWRDTNHIIGETVGTHRMFKPIRDQEVLLAQIGFNALGIRYQPVLTSQPKIIDGGVFNGHNDQSIEGGDIETMELNGDRYALIGQAERTSWEAVQAWYKLHKTLFSSSGEGLIPTVVQGPRTGTQNMMHLDTFAQQAAPGAIIHCKKITDERKYSILTFRNGEVQRIDEEVFSHWIDRQATNTYEMTREEQLLYAANVLLDGGQTVYITKDGTPQVTEFLQKHVPEVVHLHMNAVTKLYGGAHCSLSEFR